MHFTKHKEETKHVWSWIEVVCFCYILARFIWMVLLVDRACLIACLVFQYDAYTCSFSTGVGNLNATYTYTRMHSVHRYDE